MFMSASKRNPLRRQKVGSRLRGNGRGLPAGRQLGGLRAAGAAEEEEKEEGKEEEEEEEEEDAANDDAALL